MVGLGCPEKLPVEVRVVTVLFSFGLAAFGPAHNTARGIVSGDGLVLIRNLTRRCQKCFFVLSAFEHD